MAVAAAAVFVAVFVVVVLAAVGRRCGQDNGSTTAVTGRQKLPSLCSWLTEVSGAAEAVLSEAEVGGWRYRGRGGRSRSAFFLPEVAYAAGKEPQLFIASLWERESTR